MFMAEIVYGDKLTKTGIFAGSNPASANWG